MTPASRGRGVQSGRRTPNAVIAATVRRHDARAGDALGQVRSRIERTALAHARQATDLDDLSAEVRLRVAATERRRVV